MVLFVEQGKAATEMLDAMVRVADAIPPPIDPSMPDMPTLPPDYVAMPDGMDLVESSLGVIP